MRLYFDLPQLDAQLLRTISYTSAEGADIGECLSTAEKIKEDQWDSWYDNWMATAKRIEDNAEISINAGNLISARQAYLRASNYYRTAYFFLNGFPPEERLVQAYQHHVHTFSKAAELFPHPVTPVRIPYETTFLPGYFYKVDASDAKHPTLIINSGYDSTHQESYLVLAAAALKRGFHVLCFDGPGQGETLIKNTLYMRPDWENVITPVVDFLLTIPEVQADAIILAGISWGGLLTARAAAFEHRIAALITHPGQFDALDSIKKSFPEITSLLQKDENGILDKYMMQILTNSMMALKFKAKMWVHGIHSPVELLRQWQYYTLEGIVQNITCPTLVLDAENEQYSAGQAKEFFQRLICPKAYVLFANAEGAGEHCAAGALTLFHQKTFDWLEILLDKKMPSLLDSKDQEPVYSL